MGVATKRTYFQTCTVIKLGPTVGAMLKVQKSISITRNISSCIYLITSVCYPSLKFDLGTQRWLTSTTCTFLEDGTGKWPLMIFPSLIWIHVSGCSLGRCKAILRGATDTQLVRLSKPCTFLEASTWRSRGSMTFTSTTSSCRHGLGASPWISLWHPVLSTKPSSSTINGCSYSVALMEWSVMTYTGQGLKSPPTGKSKQLRQITQVKTMDNKMELIWLEMLVSPIWCSWILLT